MIINSLNSLLYIEPKNEPKYKPVMGNKYYWVLIVINEQIEKKQIGCYDKTNDSLKLGWNFRGVHVCMCGKNSTNFDILLPNNMITNSLAFVGVGIFGRIESQG